MGGHTVKRMDGTKRRLLLGPNGVRILALDGISGKVYERPDLFKLGASDSVVSV